MTHSTRISYIFTALTLIVAASLIWIDFKLYGSIFRFMPVFLAFYLLYSKKIKEIKVLILACIAVVLVTYSLKYGIEFLIDKGYLESLKDIAMRPINGRYNGFPSGHCATAFIAVAFGITYMRIEWKVLIFLLALLVFFSRISSQSHTIIQAIIGSLIGFGVSWAIFARYKA